jgi:hypothetical protein
MNYCDIYLNISILLTLNYNFLMLNLLIKDQLFIAIICYLHQTTKLSFSPYFHKFLVFLSDLIDLMNVFHPFEIFDFH